MCGICGSFAYGDVAGPGVTAMRVMRDSMVARGPDGRGEWLSQNGRVWLGHRRLAIIDLSERGAQPMTSPGGGLTVTFNGEIYNYKELRRALETKGHQFRSDSDTEVLIELYRAMGPSFISLLRGMFAFALWDMERELLMLARDPYGIKPLYYANPAGEFLFASSVKALTAHPRTGRSLDPAGFVGFFVFGSVQEPWTIYSSARALPAGTSMLIDRNGPSSPVQYHSIAKAVAEAEAEARSGTRHSHEERLREVLLDSVRHHLVADVPVGAFLSAGVDSGALTGLMRDAGQEEIQTITLAYEEFGEKPEDEAPLAETVARHYGTRHTTRRVDSHEFAADLPKIIEAMDQPTIDGINTWFVSKAAREFGLKVAISGVGGDELLGGYKSFRTSPRLAKWLRLPSKLPGMAPLFEQLAGISLALGADIHPKVAGLLRYGGSLSGAYFMLRGLFLPEELQSVVEDPEFLRLGLEQLKPLEMLEESLRDGPEGTFGKVAVLESCFYLRNQLLRDTDWTGMAHSLEIRTPLVDHVLLRRASAIMMEPNHPSGKQMLANAPLKPLPEAIVHRKKTGFGIPVESWLAKTAGIPSGLARKDRPFSRHWARQIAGMLVPDADGSAKTAAIPDLCSATGAGT